MSNDPESDPDTMLMNQTIADKLDRAPLLQFTKEQIQRGLNLEEVLRTIRSATRDRGDKGIPVYVNPAALKKAGATMQSPVTFDQEGIPPVIALRLMLRQLDLAPSIRDGVLFIGDGGFGPQLQ